MHSDVIAQESLEGGASDRRRGTHLPRFDWTLTAAERADIAARASQPAERGDADAGACDAGETWSPVVDERRKRWCRAVARGDYIRFKRVLAWRGLDPRLAAARFAPARTDGQASPPEWIEDLARMLEAAQAAPRPEAPAYCDPKVPVLDEALLIPLVEAAARGPRALLRGMGSAPDALAPLERRLLVTLGQITARCLREAGTRTRFPRALFHRYPVAARLLTGCWHGWITATTELLERLAADRTALALFLGVPDVGPPVSFSSDGADGHDDGRYVCVVQLTQERRVVYKPRDMSLDEAFRRFVQELGSRGIDVGGCVPRSLVRDGYGWAEFVEARKAADAAEHERYWRRAGALLALLTAIAGVDMHYGNVIAAGDQPVLVDLETVLSPMRPDRRDEYGAFSSSLKRIDRLMARSPLTTNLLPTMLHVGQECYVDIGAYSARDVPTDAHRTSEAAAESALLEHHATLRRSFVETLGRLRAHRSRLLAPGGPVDGFAAAFLRVIFRDTSIYGRLLNQSCAPDALVDGAERDIVLEQLARILAPYAERPPIVPVFEAEKRAMLKMDIPRFEARVDGRDLHHHDGVVAAGFFRESALAGIRRSLAALARDDDRLQERLVGLSLQARLVGWQSAPAEDEPQVPGPSAAGDGAPLAIGRALADLAVTGPEGDVAWFGVEHHAGAGFFRATGFSPHLGEGHLGIVLFLTALARRTADPAMTDLAARALPALRSVEVPYASLADRDLGLLSGLGGTVWGLAGLVRLGAPPWCLEAAARAFADGARQSHTTKWDVAGGLAGLLLGGLALREVDREAAPEAALDRIAQRLAAQVAASGIDRGGVQAGLLVGATGAGAALLHAASILDRPVLRKLGQDSLAQPGRADDGAGWARGAAGRLLCRAAALPASPDPEEIERQMRRDAAALDLVPGESDGMWRGTAGMLPAIGVSGALLSGDAADRAASRAARLTDDLGARAVANRLAPVRPALPGVVLPGLLNGVAGIGYALLAQRARDLPDLHGLAPGPAAA